MGISCEFVLFYEQMQSLADFLFFICFFKFYSFSKCGIQERFAEFHLGLS